MNRSFISVILGGFGSDGGAPVAGGDQDYGEHREILAPEVAELLKNAKTVVITPGYGMAVAKRSTRSPTWCPGCGPRASRSGSACTRSPAGCPGT